MDLFEAFHDEMEKIAAGEQIFSWKPTGAPTKVSVPRPVKTPTLHTRLAIPGARSYRGVLPGPHPVWKTLSETEKIKVLESRGMGSRSGPRAAFKAGLISKLLRRGR